MFFVSYEFLILLTLILFCRLSYGRNSNNVYFQWTMLGASLIFYGWHVPEHLLIILTSCLVDYWAGLGLAHTSNRRRRKILLIVSLSVNLGLLIFFKYFYFLTNSFFALWGVFGQRPSAPHLNIILPIGISFYTFQSMSYTIDIYRGRLNALRNFPVFFLYVSFFPQLVAGPIVRATEFLYQLDRNRRPHVYVWFQGMFLIVQGFFLKMVCADNLGRLVEYHWKSIESTATPVFDFFILALLFSFQIFGDFAGYSRIARGTAYLLGFRLPVNFNLPYAARSFSEFWRHWHITLSQWFRDYLYIPLGGSRASTERTLFHLVLVMFLCGLWHGAAWTFVLWGTLHGLAMAIERMLGFHRVGKESVAWWVHFAWPLVTQISVLMFWVWFRSESLTQGLSYFYNLAHALTRPTAYECSTGLIQDIFAASQNWWTLITSGPFGAESWLQMIMTGFFPVLVDAVPLLTVPIIHLHGSCVRAGRIQPLTPSAKAILTGLMLIGIFTCYGHSTKFIYFQF